MNIHPLFVHFPIALLTIYALMELIPLAWKARFPWWKGAGSFLVTLGWILTLPTAMTGEIAEKLLKDKVDIALIEKHSMFAGMVMSIFFLFFAAQLIRVFKERGWGDKISAQNSLFAQVWDIKQKFAHVVLDTFVTKILAFLGLVVLIITGALGGAIAYNPDIDPLVSAIYHLFF